MRAPRRLLWLILIVETAFFVILAVWVLTRLDRLFELESLLIALAIIVAGDIATVLIMQRIAPTRVLFSAGESDEHIGEAVAGFGSEPHGRVLIRGEQWSARYDGSPMISPGDRVRVISRGGLVLHVELWE